MSAGPPIFLVSRFRSGSSFLWNLFRQDPHHCCFYEPFHDNLKEAIEADLSVMQSHRGLSSYWDEYKPVHDQVLRYHRPEFGLCRLLLRERDEQPELLDYINTLLQAAADQDRVCVMKCNRLDFRLAWLRANFPEARIIHVVRNARDQWVSSVRPLAASLWDKLEENRSYDLPLWISDLSIDWPFLTSHAARPAYFYSYLVWKLSLMCGRRHAHLKLNFDTDVVLEPARLRAALAPYFPGDFFERGPVQALFMPPKPKVWRKFRSASWFRDLEAEAEAVLRESGVYKRTFWDAPVAADPIARHQAARGVRLAVLAFSRHRGDLLLHVQQMQSSYDEATRFAASLADVQDDLSGASAAYEDLKKAFAEKAEGLTKAAAAYEALARAHAGTVAALRDATTAYEKLQKTLRERDEMLRQARAAYEDLQTLLAGKEKALHDASRAYAELQGTLAQREQALHDAGRAYAELQATLARREQALHDAGRAYQDLQDTLAQREEALRQAGRAYEELRNTLAERETALRQAGQAYDDLARVHTASIAACDTATAAYEELKRVCESREAALREASIAYAGLKREHDELSSRLAAASRAYSSLEDERQEKTAALHATTAALEDLQRSHVEALREREDLRHALETRSTALRAAGEAYADLQRSYAEKLTALQQASAAYAELQHALAERERSLQAASTAYGELQGFLGRREVALRDASAAYQELQRSYAGLLTSFAQLQDHAQTLTADLVASRVERERLDAGLRTVREELGAATTALREHELRIRELTFTKAQLMEQLSQENAEHNRTRDTHAEAEKQLSSEVARLRMNLERAKLRLAALEKSRLNPVLRRLLPEAFSPPLSDT